MSIFKLLNFTIFMVFYLGFGISVAHEENIYNPEEQRIAQKCLENAKKGDVRAMYCIGFSYRYGIGVKQNYQQSMKWNLKVIESNSREYSSAAKAFIGDYYQYGVENSKQQAMQWYLKAVDEGNSYAMYQIGNLYKCKSFVKYEPKECQQAIQWYLKAADEGNIDAPCKLSEIYQFGLGVERDLNKQKYWSRKCESIIRD